MKKLLKSELDIVVEALQVYVDQEWIQNADRETANELLESIGFFYGDKNLLTEEERLLGAAADGKIVSFLLGVNEKQ